MSDVGTGPAVSSVEPALAVTRARPSFKSSVARNVASTWAITVASVVYSLVITPIVIRALNRDLYGVWTFLNGLLAYADLLYLGVGAALVKYVAHHTALVDQPAVNRLASVVLSILTTIGFGCFLFMTAISPVIPSLLGSPLVGEAARGATYTCVLLGVQLWCFFGTSTYIAILVGHDRFDLFNLTRFISLCLRVVIVTFAVRAPSPLVGLAVGMTLAVLFDLMVFRAFAHRVSPGLRLGPVRPTQGELKQIYSFGFQSFLIQLSSKLISYTDVVVIGVSLGATAVSLYVLPLQLIEYVRIALNGISGVLLPRLTEMVAHEDFAALRAAYMQATRLVSLLAAFLIANLTWLGVPFLTLWVGPEFGEPARWVVVYLAIATFFHLFTSIVALPFYQALGIMAVPAQVMIAEAFFNLAASVILVGTLGIQGVALATLVPAFVSFLVLPPYLWRKLTVSSFEVCAHSLIPAALMAVSVAGMQFVTDSQIPSTSYGALAFRIATTVPVAALVTVAFLSSDERGWIINVVSRRRSARIDSGWE